MQKLKHMISKEIENWVDRNCFEWLIWCCLWWHIAGEWGWWIADEGNRRRQACWAKTSKKVDSRWGPKWDSGASHRGIIPQSRLLQRDLTISSQQTISQSHIQTPIIFAPGDQLKPSCKLFMKCSLHLLEEKQAMLKSSSCLVFTHWRCLRIGGGRTKNLDSQSII